MLAAVAAALRRHGSSSAAATLRRSPHNTGATPAAYNAAATATAALLGPEHHGLRAKQHQALHTLEATLASQNASAQELALLRESHTALDSLFLVVQYLLIF